MGRSVSTPNNTVLVEYLHLTQERYWCPECDNVFDDPVVTEQACGHPQGACPHCGDITHYQEQDSQFLFEDFSEDLKTLLKEAFPSLNPDEKWLGREDKALLSNSYAYFGISTYCGLVAVWVAAKEEDWRSSGTWHSMRDRWIASIEKRFAKTVGKAWGTPLTKAGTFSNGEAVFQKKES